jgi:tetratricopeptide (TPR) repeat protein
MRGNKMKFKKGLVWLIGLGCLIASFAQATTREEQLEFAESYSEQVEQYYQQGQFDKALRLAERTFNIRTEFLGEQHPDTIENLVNLAVIYYNLGQIKKALSLSKKSYRLNKQVLGEKHRETLASLNNLAEIYRAEGFLSEALDFSEKGYRLSLEVLGEKDPDTIGSLNKLAAIYLSLGRLSDALPLSKKSYRLSQEVLGEKNPFTLTSLHTLAEIHRALGDLSEVLPLSEKGYRLSQEVLGNKHPNTLSSLNNLALIYQKLGRLDEALPLFEKSLRLNQEALGEKHPNTLTSLNNLAMIYLDLGRLDEALHFAEKGYRLSQEKFGEKHSYTMTNLNSLAVIYQTLGRLSDALLLFEKNYRLKLEYLGKTHPLTLISLNNLAIIYLDLARLDEALFLFEKGYDLNKEVLGEKHPDTLTSLNNLATIYQKLGHLDNALSLFEETYRLRKEELGEEHLNILESLNNLAMIYQDLGRLDEALPLFEKGYNLRKDVLGEKHPDTLTSLNNLATIYQELGRLDEALFLFEETYRLRKEELGEKHPNTLLSLNNLAYVHTTQGNIDKGIKYFEQLVKDVEVLRQRGSLSADNRQALFQKWIESYFVLSGLYIIQGSHNDAFRIAEKTKYRTLIESITLKLAAQKALNQTDRQELQKYQAAIFVLSDNIAKELAKEKRLEHEILRESVVEKRQLLEIDKKSAIEKRLVLEREKNLSVKKWDNFHRTLMKKYPKYAQLKEIEIVTAKKGASLIPENALFISYLVQDNHVLVLTLDSTGNLQAKDLGEIPNLNQTLKTYKQLLGHKCTVKQLQRTECGGNSLWQIADGSFMIGDKPARIKKPKKVYNLGKISRYLAQKLLEPIKESIHNKKRLIISPDGTLALIPFEPLILDNKLVIETHQVSYVHSLSVLKLLKEREKEYQKIEDRKTLLAMGAARYEPCQENQGSETGRFRNFSKMYLETTLTRSTDPQRYQDAFRSRGMRCWQNIPYSEMELTKLEELFSGEQPRIFKGENASETQLKQLSNNETLARYQYLVFSAHGYLDREVPALSAIVLDQLNKPENTDGYVTAAEWPSYDLRSDLMVLSACQTGLGKVLRGEGVIGLPYAFYVAGNKNTLMTLWEVADESTAEFTTSFFEKLKKGQNQIEALTATKREFLKSKYKWPLYWAPFVLYGF